MATRKNYKSNEACVACGLDSEGMVCHHHVKSRGSGGTDDKNNLMPLCFKCHELVHRIGLNSMADSKFSVRQWLLNNNWSFDFFLNKWVSQT